VADSMRSINSFGVAGLLDSKADVFYSNDLRARNIGRVSDLVSAKLRESDIDELRIRALLVYGVFQSYAVRLLSNHHHEEIPPVSVEIGLDAAHVVVAVAFHWESENEPNWEGLAERIDSQSGADAFEKALGQFHIHSNQVVVRYEAEERRIEIVGILNRTNSEIHDPTMVVPINSTTTPLLEVSKYIELGDLNFSKLLKNPVAETEVKIPGEKVAEEEDVRRIAGSAGEETAETKVISGASKADPDKALAAIREKYESTVSELKNTVHELKERLESAENAASERRFTSDSGSADEEPILVKGAQEKEEKEDDWGVHFLKQVWPFAPKADAKKEKEDPKTVEKIEADSDLDEERVITIEGEKTSDSDDAVVVEDKLDDAAEATLRELQDIAKSSKSKKLEETLHEIEEEAEPDKAKRWVDSLSSELLQEKARLNELQRNLTKQIRQRELEFKTSERALKQELKRKDEIIAQRQAAIENKTDQIAQLNLAVERASTATNDKESQQIKVKLDRAQRMSQMKDEEAKALLVKVRDLENRLIIAQAKAQKGNDLQAASKIVGLEKKVDEYKRINQRLMESLNSQKEKSNDKEVGDLRRKIDQLDRLLAEGKRNMEKSAFKFRELQESEKKLQIDLARAVEENRSLRKNAVRGSGESGGQAA
jgi:hypothetical protein